MHTKGTERSRRFFEEIVSPLLDRFESLRREDFAVALIGEGSEVLGFDDEVSTDHNFWPRTTVFYRGSDRQRIDQAEISAALDTLPERFSGHKVERTGDYASLSFHEIEEFASGYLDIKAFPPTENEWLTIDEQRLLEISSATVFHDPKGIMSSVIQELTFYPDQMIPLLICRGLSRLSEVGAIERAIVREDEITARLYFMEFAVFAVRLFHHLSGRYCPYLKWMMRSLRSIHDGKELSELVAEGFRVSSITRYRQIVVDCYQILARKVRAIYEIRDDNEGESDGLRLLRLPGIESLMAEMRKKVPGELRGTPDYVQPSSYWGVLFDYSGYGLSFKQLIAETLRYAK